MSKAPSPMLVPAAPHRLNVSWLWLAIWIVATVAVSLSIHVVMLDGLHIPHPDNTHIPMPAIFLNDALSLTAAILVYRLGRERFAAWVFPIRCLVLGALYAMLAEALLRGFIMDGVVSHDWLYCLVENLARPVDYMIVAVLVVGLAPWLTSGWRIGLGALAIVAVTRFVIDPPIDAAFAKWVASLEYLDTGNLYNPPYGWQVIVPSYLTFLEPVVAAFAIAALVWDQLSARPVWRAGQFVLLIMAMKGSIAPTLIYSFFQHASPPAAILSESQFGMEILVMAAMTAVGWRFSQPRPPLAAAAPTPPA